MMKFYFLFAFIVCSNTSFSQDDNIKRNSVFRSFEEFKNNTPSMCPAGITVKEAKDKVTYYYTDSTGVLKKIKNSFWGFSDSQYVYIIHDGNYGRFIEIGSLCMFTYHFNTVEYSPNAFGKEAGHRMEGDKTYILIFETGEIIELTSKNMSKILAGDPKLLEEFESEEVPDQEKRSYIWKYNEQHPFKN